MLVILLVPWLQYFEVSHLFSERPSTEMQRIRTFEHRQDLRDIGSPVGAMGVLLT